MVVILQATLMPNDLAVEFVDQFVHGRVQISMGALGKHVGALDVNIAFGALAQVFLSLLFYGEQHFDIDHLVKMSLDPVKLGGYVTAQGRGNLEVMAANRQIHK